MKKIRLVLVCCLCASGVFSQTMKSISGGSFSMGNASYARESPVRTVSVGTFYMSTTAITNSQFADFLNAYGSDTLKDGDNSGQILVQADSWGVVKENGSWKASAGFENYPVIKVSWFGADAYCRYNNGRLPTEAEWEYAAKGGPSQQTFTFSGSSTAANVAWFADNSSHLNHAVGLKAANTLGLYDMSGNVYQWCSDWFDRYGNFGVAGESNPKGPADGVSRVIRGGYRSISSGDLHLTGRESLSPDECLNFVGFRLVMDKLPDATEPVSASVPAFYPNPATDHIVLTALANIQRFELLDLQGRLLKSLNQPSGEVSLTGIVPGAYTVRLSGNGFSKTQKLIVR